MSSPPAFGKELREQEFYLTSDYALLNNGSYGAAPKRVIAVKHQHEEDMEKNPDNWYARIRPDLEAEGLRKLSEFVGAKVENLAFVENATRGCNDALKCLNLQAGDGILINNFTYLAIQNAVEYIKDFNGVTVFKIELKFPLNSFEDLVRTFTEFLDAHTSIKVVVLDHISSMPSLLFPVKQLAEVFRARGIKTIVDGAHVPNQIDVNIEDLKVDFYIANLHKWTFASRGCAFIYAAEEMHNTAKPVVTALYNFGFPGDFTWQGARDHCTYSSVSEAFNFIEWLGGRTRIEEYTKDLGDWTANELTSTWQTDMLPIGNELVPNCLRTIRIPDTKAFPKTPEGTSLLVTALRELYKIRANIGYFRSLNNMYVRVSCAAYVDREDIAKFRDAMMELKDLEPEDQKIIDMKNIKEDRSLDDFLYD
ncbi:DgyrCDS12209 [Dimorphilus gyrociliatus]|uniref:DgyrCDS12209 n=1 Tax=Dimorphilus gyrociliatus TaxID=2664684 RepID=A0A7I8W702_9ANNE|nr:DgyrCDS12209 [Dimorphilus gyrociliatus]